MGDSEKIPKEIVELLADMKKKLEGGWGSVAGKKLVNVEDMLQTIENIQKNLPEEIYKAIEIYRDREKILQAAQNSMDQSRKKIIKDQEEAKKKIENALADAARRRNETIQRGEQEAKARAEAILADAQAR
ncbi:MAG TPA: hypothetical protein PKW24_02545, partial [Clostridiales bacterium]|nr:hypothetical protein [Clostridiales bacterium]